MADVVAKHVDSFLEMREPGAFHWIDDPPTRLYFRCPCGCGSVGGVVVRGDSSKGPIWGWDGNKISPTIMPSIRFLSGCCWHGFLTAGVFKSC